MRLTHDRAGSPQQLRFYTVERLGEKQSLTPEGFLVCEDVPIARTGEMIYGPGETPLSPGHDGIVHVLREESEVFRPEYIASYVGKSVVDDHPPDEVRPDNWREYEVGVVVNPRRGTGLQVDCIIADLVIKDPAAIAAVQAGKRQVSCGYDADYEQTAPGHGRQLNMIGNHVALVDAGRCGPRCSIHDQRPSESPEMKTRDNAAPSNSFLARVLDKIGKAIANRDSAGLEAATKEARDAVESGEMGGEGGEHHMHIHVPGVTDETFQAHVEKNDKEHRAFDERLGALEAAAAAKPAEPAADADDPAPAADPDGETAAELEEEAPAAAKDSVRKARDSAFMADSFQDTLAAAEILVPGIKAPVFDRAATPAKTLDSLCQFRRKALDTFGATPEGAAVLGNLTGGRPLQLAEMKCGAVRTMFRAAAATMRTLNNDRMRRGSAAAATQHAARAPVRTLADLNKMHEQHYAGKQ